MSKKQIIISLSILGVLLLALFLKNIYLTPPVEEKEYQKLEFDLSFVEKITLEKGKKINLEKTDKGWVIKGDWIAKANEKKIEDLLKTFSNLEAELRSEKEELLSDYGLKGKEIVVSFKDKKGELKKEFILGTKKPIWGTSFLREADSFKVYLVNKDLLSLIGLYGDILKAELKRDFWVDLNPLDFDEEKIDGIEVEKNIDNQKVKILSLERKKEGKTYRWISHQQLPFSLSAQKIKDFIKRVKNIYMVKAVEPKETYGFDNPYLNFILKTEKGNLTITIGNKEKEDKEERFVKMPDGFTYIISSYWIEQLSSDASKFFIDNPLKIDKEKLKSLTINTKKQKMQLDKDRISKNISYLDKLKKFSVKKLIGDKISFNLPSPYSIKIEYENNGELTLYVKKLKEGYLARLQNNSTVFEITKEAFEDIFENLDKLN